MAPEPTERSEVIREVNAAILSAAKRLHPHGSETWDFYCECDRIDCAEVVRLTLEEYTSLRTAEQPVLAGGHVLSRGEAARRNARERVEEARALEAQARGQVARARKRKRVT